MNPRLAYWQHKVELFTKRVAAIRSISYKMHSSINAFLGAAHTERLRCEVEGAMRGLHDYAVRIQAIEPDDPHAIVSITDDGMLRVKWGIIGIRLEEAESGLAHSLIEEKKELRR